MYISEISIEGYKNCNNKLTVKFNRGLNVIVGENTSGKTSVIDAVRMVFKENEMKYITGDNFYKSFKKEEEKKNIHISIHNTKH